jgi:hypothetical protein
MAYRALIPAYGYGKRVGMAKNRSKELLIDPETNQPLIQWHFDLCKKHKLSPLVITRKDKKDLIKYCELSGVECLVIPDHTGEWYDTVLMSKHRWFQYNILLLPDTKFKPQDIIKVMKRGSKNGTTVAVHIVGEVDKWGIITFRNMFAFMCEKPDTQYSVMGLAWGILGFDKVEGEALMKGFKSRSWFNVNLNLDNVFHLFGFRDLTRDMDIKWKLKK